MFLVILYISCLKIYTYWIKAMSASKKFCLFMLRYKFITFNLFTRLFFLHLFMLV